MRKTCIIMIGLFVAIASISTLAVKPVQAYISTHNWITPFYRGYDVFLGTSVVAYESGSTAGLLVTVYNDWDWWYPFINVTDVKVWFDWNINYSSAETPFVMDPYTAHSFMINFTVPDTSVASNLIPHTYIIYVEFSYDGSSYYWTQYGYNFAVYSADQADAMDTYIELSFKLDYAPDFHSYEANMLLSKALTDYSLGTLEYMRANFVAAKTYYDTGLYRFDEAFAIESDHSKTLDVMEIDLIQAEIDAALAKASATALEAQAAMAQANATMKEADAALLEAQAAMAQANATMTEADANLARADAAATEAYAWILFGVGWMLIGVGVIVYGIRRPKA